MIRIVLADDHAMIRQALARALADTEGFEVVGEAGNGREALEVVARVNPNVLLMDVGMPDMDGLKATEAMRANFPGVVVLILTVHEREDYFFKALQAGASGYVLKGADMDELVEAILTVSAGSIYVTPSLMPKLITDYVRLSQSDGAKPGSDSLSPREQQVLRLIAEGQSTKDIADTLVISPHTVRRHRDHIMNKLNLHSKAELISFAVRRGILDKSA